MKRDLKKRWIWFVAWIPLFIYGTGMGQSISDANIRYQKFNQMRLEGAEESAIYDMLYLCFQDFVAVVEKARPDSPDYIQAKRTLREICPFLQSGAAYYSSRNNQKKALLFAQAFMDIPLLDAFRAETFNRDKGFPTMAYFAASGTYNSGNYAKAIDYFQVYLGTTDNEYRQTVYMYMAKACMNVGDYGLAMQVLEEASNRYPSNFNLLSMAINSCIEQEDEGNLQRFVSKALALRPSDETLLNLQGKLYENRQDFQQALSIYLKLKKSNPGNLEIAQHIALNYYNLGVINHNKATLSASEADKNRYTRLSKEYFASAASFLKVIVDNVPSSVKYMQALATAYGCLGEKENLASVNGKLSALGGEEVSLDASPAMIAYEDKADSPHQGTSSPVDHVSAGYQEETPLYSQYAKDYVEKRIREWQAKDPYETVAEYQNRVTEKSRDAKVKELLKEAEASYIATYTKYLRFNDMILKPYDADHGSFLVESKYGNLIVPVPRENQEAQVFESSWSNMRFEEPRFYINNDRLMLSGLTFVTPIGNRYRYDGNQELGYAETVVDIAFEPIEVNTVSNGKSGSPTIGRREIMVGASKSDVDVDIPQSDEINEDTYALVIANENYSMVSKVPFALNDGQVFVEYCTKTLGIPQKNVLFYQDASYGIMLNAMDRIKRIAAAYDGEVDLLVYYAGHGIPDESSRDAFLLPVDADGKQTKVCYPISELYAGLGATNARSVTVFLDACFSGAKRDGGMVAEARGVAIKPKLAVPQGNTVVFSAVSDDETALPYEEKGHGMFTYFLLKKLQETSGRVSLQDLGEYIGRQVSRESEIVNNKSQTPTISVSATYEGNWQSKKLRP